MGQAVDDSVDASTSEQTIRAERTEIQPPRHRLPRRKRRLIDYPRRGKKGVRRWLPSWRLVFGLIFTFVVLLVGAFYIALAMVRIPQANDFATRQASIFDYSDGHTQIAHIGVNRISVPLNEIPLVVQHAVLAAEDRSFYTEPAVSPTGILRALRNDVSGSGSLQGGSTITQQYVKNYYLTERQTVSRKLDEALVAIKIDQRMSKDTILQNYLNTVFFARGAYGIQAATRAYFGVDVSSLANDPTKAAYLAALVQQPYYFGTASTDPAAQKALTGRWWYVLNGMVAEHWLTKQVLNTLKFPATIAAKTNDLAGPNGYLVNAAMSFLDQAHQQDPGVPDSAMISRGGYTVVTTFQQGYMSMANQVVQQDLATMDPQHNAGDQNVHIGLAAIDSDTGAVIGCYGGADYVTRGYNDATQAGGPLGSTVATMLANGVDARPKTNWPGAVSDLRKLGVMDANPKDNPPSDDDLTTTPLHAATAFEATANHGIVYQPYEVAEVRYDGNVIWRATPTAQGFQNSGGRAAGNGLQTSGIDGSHQWAWSVGGFANIAVAVDMYATKPNGKTNRVMNGMSPFAHGVSDRNAPPVPEQRTTAMWMSFLTNAVRSDPGLLVGMKADEMAAQATTSSAPPAAESTTAKKVTTPTTTHTAPPTQTTTTGTTGSTTTNDTTDNTAGRTSTRQTQPPTTTTTPKKQ